MASRSSEVGVLIDIVDCGLGKKCKLDGVKPHDHRPNPKAGATKASEMTVLRAIQLIEAFNALDPEQDWTDVPGATYRKVIGERYEYGTLLSECYTRFKMGTLHREVLELAANLPPASLERSEIKNGLDAIRKELDSRSKRRAAGSSPRRGQRRRTA